MNQLRPISEGMFHVGDLRFVAGIVDGVIEWCGAAVYEDTMHVHGVYARKCIGDRWTVVIRAPVGNITPTHYDPDAVPPL